MSRKGGHAIATAPHAGFERQRDTGAIRLAFFTPIQLSDSIERALMYEAANGRELTLTYTGGSQKLLVPEGVPIVMSVPADRSLLKPGEYVSVTANVGADGKMTAQRIQVSQDGVKPPQ